MTGFTCCVQLKFQVFNILLKLKLSAISVDIDKSLGTQGLLDLTRTYTRYSGYTWSFSYVTKSLCSCLPWFTFPYNKRATATRPHAMGQGYPLTGPSPGAVPPIYPSSPPLAWGNLLSNILVWKGEMRGPFVICGMFISSRMKKTKVKGRKVSHQNCDEHKNQWRLYFSAE